MAYSFKDKIEHTDSEGNFWRVEIKPRKFYGRYQITFRFNGTQFRIKCFQSVREAKDFWNLFKNSKYIPEEDHADS